MVAHRPAVRQLESRRLMQVAADRGRVGRRSAAGAARWEDSDNQKVQMNKFLGSFSGFRLVLWLMAVGGVQQGSVVVGKVVGKVVGFLRATRRLGLCVGRALAG